MKRAIIAIIALALTGCASMDAAHIEGQKQDAAKYTAYSAAMNQQALAVQGCFASATTDNQLAMCAIMGTATGLVSTFAGRPTHTTIAPTSGQVATEALKAVAPYAAAAAIAGSVADVQRQAPVVVEPPPALIVRPEVVNPLIVRP